MNQLLRILSAVGALLAVSTCVYAQSGTGAPPMSRGEYVFRISGCAHCHIAENGAPLAGGRALETPFGTFYTPNITAHPTEGIGGWSAEDFANALLKGVSPDGSDYYPAFPFTSYTRLHAEDVRAMYDYIMSQPASDQPNRDHELAWYVSWRVAAMGWKWLFFDAGEFEDDPALDARLNRGAYIAEAMGHCGECHTPRNLFGAMRGDMAYAGNPEGPEDELVPNITPHGETGIGKWERDWLIDFLKFGELPDGEYTAGSMDAVIEGMRHLTSDDRAALADFLRALPPIDNKVSQ